MMRALALAVAAACVAAPPLRAQQPVACQADRTITDCYSRNRGTGGAEVPDSIRKQALADAAQRLQAKQAGPDLSSAGPLAAIADFLPRLATELLAPVSGGADAPDLGFKANLPLNQGPLIDLGATLQGAVVIHQAVVSPRLLDSVPPALRAAAQARLEADLEPYDDATLTASLNLENQRFGRSLRQHRAEIGSLFVALAGADRAGDQSRVERADDRYDAFRNSLEARAERRDTQWFEATRIGTPECTLRAGPSAPGPADVGEFPVACLSPAGREALEAEIGLLAGAVARNRAARDERLKASGFTHLAQLVNNQPQLNAAWEYHSRRGVVGPNEWTGRARFELGFANMNGLRRSCGGKVDPACLSKYVNDPAVRSSLARGDRMFVQLDVTRRNTWRLSIPQDSVDIRLASATTLAAGAGYGAYIGNPEDGENRDRLDGQAKWDFARNDAARQNRFVASLFYTRHLTGQASALIGLSYANRPEFLGDVDRKLRANLGLTYKLNQSAESLTGTSK
ncbi:MAG TPA: hypothetical protein VFE05_11570 [Longimicrobiaceae bacterium]|jgi:hypothetical protein|nr:hypothetical protein [Longimicrobiaceae bacterium]